MVSPDETQSLNCCLTLSKLLRYGFLVKRHEGLSYPLFTSASGPAAFTANAYNHEQRRIREHTYIYC
jgi:hypothetical protein